MENWNKELNKWLGIRVHPLPIGSTVAGAAVKKAIEMFKISPAKDVLIISYGYFRQYIDLINTIAFDLLVCDEGHKLKNANSKNAKAVASIPSKRRILLTGTPVQVRLAHTHSLSALSLSLRLTASPPHRHHPIFPPCVFLLAERPGGILCHVRHGQPVHFGHGAVVQTCF